MVDNFVLALGHILLLAVLWWLTREPDPEETSAGRPQGTRTRRR